jgi:hypothetical protein
MGRSRASAERGVCRRKHESSDAFVGWPSATTRWRAVTRTRVTGRRGKVALSYVTYLPYLPLREWVKVGEWELIPRGELLDADALDARALELALGLADLYELPLGAGREVGAFGRREGGRVGDDPQVRTHMTNLQRSLVAPVVEVTRRSEQGGRTIVSPTMTSDNAIVITQGLTGGPDRRRSLPAGGSVKSPPDSR